LGDLVLPLAALQIIEEASRTPEELQTNYAIVDQCSNKSRIRKLEIALSECKIWLQESQDECAAAAGIYQCGVEKAPNVTKAIRTELSPGTTASVKLKSLIAPILNH
jgi:hypothetical protein